MSRDTSLPTGVVAAATAPAYSARHALRIAFATPLLVCEGPGSMVVNGETYSEGIVSIGKVQVGPTPTITIRVRNGANEVSAVDADSDGARDVAILFYEVLWDSATGIQLNPVLIFPGVVDQVQYVGGYADLQCTSRAPGQQYAGMVGRYVGQTCGHTFNSPAVRTAGSAGARCGYAGGATSCDHTMATCQALGNFQRFGGFPSVPAIGTLFSYKVKNGTTQSAIAGASASPVLTVSVPPIAGDGSPLRRRLRRTP